MSVMIEYTCQHCCFSFSSGRVEDDADGEEVVDTLEATLLLLHLLPDGVDALGAPLHVELQSGLSSRP
jgi:hypothetical protein